MRTDCEGNIFYLRYYGYSLASYLKEIPVRSTLAAVVLLQLKFSRPFTSVISFKAFYMYGIEPLVFHFLSNVNIQAKSHFVIFQVLLFFRSTYCFKFLCTK